MEKEIRTTNREGVSRAEQGFEEIWKKTCALIYIYIFPNWIQTRFFAFGFSTKIVTVQYQIPGIPCPVIAVLIQYIELDKKIVRRSGRRYTNLIKGMLTIAGPIVHSLSPCCWFTRLVLHIYLFCMFRLWLFAFLGGGGEGIVSQQFVLTAKVSLSLVQS